MIDVRKIAPPSQGNNPRETKAYAIFIVAGFVAFTYPGSLVGMLTAYIVWRITRPDVVTRWFYAALAAATAVGLAPDLGPRWSWTILSNVASFGSTPAAPLHTILTSIPDEMLLGPLILVCWELGLAYRITTIHGEEWQRFNTILHRKRVLAELASPGSVPPHPKGAIRLGYSLANNKPFDLTLQDIAQHVFLPGTSGSGKTTTLMRLADGAIRNGCGVVIVDCKGVSLGHDSKRLADAHSITYTGIDPNDPMSPGYDPCTGDAAAIANKLIGAFSFSDEAEIYKHVAMEVLPVICRAMLASGQPITLTSIYQTLAPGGLARLGRRAGAEAFQDRLDELDQTGGLGTSGYLGMQKRFGALIEGTFGPLLHRTPALNWQRETQQQRVTYLSISATAASEDAQLFGRVVTQDLKQLCDQRLRALANGEDLVPILLIYDEFAALREAIQVVDLLLQARQARIMLVISTQYLPEEPAIRKPALSAGLLLVHAVEAEDAEVIAAQFGTHTTTAITAQVEFNEGLSNKGSARWVEEYNVHPNELKALPQGVAAIYVRRTRTQGLVHVYLPPKRE